MGHPSGPGTLPSHRAWPRRQRGYRVWPAMVMWLIVLSIAVFVVDAGVPHHPGGRLWAAQAADRIGENGDLFQVGGPALLAACVHEFNEVIVSIQRSTAMFECFSGFGDTAAAVPRAGFTAHTFDMRDSPFEDGTRAVEGC